MSASVALIVITALTNVLMLAVLGSLARSGIAGIRECTRGAILVFVSLIGLAAQAFLPPVLGVVAANLLMAAGAACYVAAVLRFFGRQAPVGWLVAAVGAQTAAIALFWYVWPDTNARIVAVSLLQCVMMAAMATTIHRWRPRNRPGYPYLFAFYVAGFEAVGHALRGMFYAARIEVMPTLAQGTPMHLLFLSIGVLAMPSLTLGMILMVHDRMLAQRESEANTDSLTGTLSRKAWRLLAEKTVARAIRGDQRLSLLMLDIDRFKQVNDTHGHAMGDAVLQHFGMLAVSVFRQEDIIGRLGGEEFVVLLPDTRIDAAAFATDRLLQRVRASRCADAGAAVSYTFSGGLVEWDGEETVETMMRRADGALYAAKMAGRDRIVVA